MTYILENSLIPGFENNTEVFIQGITVCEGDRIVLVDGQQRTTFFYLLMKYLGYDGRFEMKYDIRKESNDWDIQLSLKNDNTIKENTQIILNNYGFAWNDRINGFELNELSKEDVIDKIKNLGGVLANINVKE